MTTIGAVLGVLAAVLGIWGMTIVFGAVDDLDKALNGQGGVISGFPLASDPVPAETVKQLAFGQTFTYEDGVVVTVDSPSPYKPSSTAAMSPDAARAAAVKVTITAGSTKPLDLMSVSIQATAGEQAAGQVYDSEKNMLGIPTQTLPPGKRQTFTVVFGLPSEPTELRVQVGPGRFHSEPVFFTGQV